MVFAELAQYYNLLYDDKGYHREVDYVDSLLIKYCREQVVSILDVGCGTGRHAELLAQKGYNVHGMDLSSDMIGIAKQKESKNLHFITGDASNFSLPIEFDAIVSLFHVINYHTTNDALRNAISCVSRHLRKNGLFVFDFWYGPAVLNEKPSTRIKRVGDGNCKVTRLAEPEMHPDENCVTVHYEMIIEKTATRTVETVHEHHKVRYLFKPEIEALLGQSGFKMLEFSEFLTGKQPDFNTWGVVCVGEKT